MSNPYVVNIRFWHAWQPTLRLTKVRSEVIVYPAVGEKYTVYDQEPYDGLISLSLPAGTYVFRGGAYRMGLAFLPEMVVDSDKTLDIYLPPYYTMRIEARDRSTPTDEYMHDVKIECGNLVPSVSYTGPPESPIPHVDVDYGYDAHRKNVTVHASKPGYDPRYSTFNSGDEDFEEDLTFYLNPTGWEPEPSTFEHIYVETYKDYEIHYFPMFEMYGVYLFPGGSPPAEPVPIDDKWRTHQTVTGCRVIIDVLVGEEEPVFVQNYPPPPTHMDPGWVIYHEPGGVQRLFAVDAGTGQMVSAYWSNDNLAGLLQWLKDTYVTEGLVYTHRGIPVYFQLRDLEYYATVGTRTRHFYDWGFQACLDWIDSELEEPPGEPFTSIIDFVVPASLSVGSTINVRVLAKNTGTGAGRLEVIVDGNPNSPDSYITVAYVTTPADVQPGSSVWLDITLSASFNMPAWDYNLTSRNYDETSQISKTISLSAPVGIPTTTTITAPDRVASGEGFDVYGSLIEKDTGTRIPGQRINLSYDGKSLGYTYTDPEGDYYFTVSVPEGGTFTLKAEFPGTPGYAASASMSDMSVEMTLIDIAIKGAVPLLTGIALRYLGTLLELIKF